MKQSTLLILALFLLYIMGCKQNNSQKTEWNTKKIAQENEVHNQLLDIEKEQGWQLLFDGETLDGWHLYNKPDSTKFSTWVVRDGMLYCNAKDESKVHGDLITDSEFEDYEFAFEWKISARGNSGIFINVQERPDILNTYNSGPEYQMLDTDHMDYDVPEKRPGSLYGFVAQMNTVEVKPTGQWNTSIIKQKNGKIEFYLNGVLTAKEDFNSPDWKSGIAASGFGKNSEFGQHTKGKLALQNWYFDVWFRNMKLREL